MKDDKNTSSKAQKRDNKEDLIELEGVVREALPGSRFLVEITEEEFVDGHEVIASVSGKIAMHHIKIVPGDKVRVVVSIYNYNEGRITYRLK